MPPSSPIEAFVEKHTRLIELERLAEIEESARLQASLTPAELEARGVTLLRLKVADERSGLGGRTLLVLEPTREGDLPAHRFQPGDIAAIRPGKGGAASAATAVVYRVLPRRITVALDVDPDEPFDEPLRLDRVANDVTYRRLKEGLERLRTYARGPASRLRETLFGLRDPQGDAPRPLAPLDAGLDASQREAVAFALGAKEIALIHGPPGTGKTTAAVEAIRQAVARGDRVLACAASNIAVDNVAERLVAGGVRVVRVGHPARLLPSVVDRSLDALVEAAEGTRIAQDVRRELEQVRRKQRRAATRQERYALRDDLRRLRAEVRELEERAVRDVLAAAEVILATNVGAGDPVLAELDFDLVVIDEAAQALEASCWIPLLKGRRAILAGDHRQLPPTIRSREAEREGLAVTLFDRLAARHGESILRMLTVQYRMHREIMAWPSRELYEGRLEAHASVAGHLLAQLPGLAATSETQAPLLFIDTAGCGFEESIDPEGESKWNEGEMGTVARHLEALVAAGLSPTQVAVITPYNAQVDRLRAALLPLHPGLEIGSVDGFQGREKEAIVISLVRSNPRGEVGFLADDRRTNVAITRARRHLAVVGDSSTVASHGFLARFIEHCQQRGAYRSAWEYGGDA
jgi:ATP-dependent RNA/DNA helicase IGHMBP2